MTRRGSTQRVRSLVAGIDELDVNELLVVIGAASQRFTKAYRARARRKNGLQVLTGGLR